MGRKILEESLTLMEREKEILDILYEYGPQRTSEIAEHINRNKDYLRGCIDLLVAEGKVAGFKRGVNHYWILAEDLQEQHYD